MSNKPSYAAVTASSPKHDLGQQQESPGSSTAKPSDAPPPYDGPVGASKPPHGNMPDNPMHQQQQQQGFISHPHSHPGQVEQCPAFQGQWIPPSESVAKSRALRRFWSAFIWGWVIWIAIGLLIGGGFSDMEHNPLGRHGHWDKHGEWHNDYVKINIAAHVRSTT
ncbi:uncharacterized protein L203_103018 [Cryptococcus depauperatus CBS 7841]|uniref:Uncharacterized protein n=1 Tax=Cryptococcus depauperatus CBS 7841 TaxID=1295531 RepID=A0A1E3IPU6_9TREE|nr:hypothetical protein L203_01713 [Cryptococcus depauperatus CBS 7841]